MPAFIESLEQRRLFSSYPVLMLSEKAIRPFEAKFGTLDYSVGNMALEVRIDWGDGHVTRGKLRSTSKSGHFIVLGRHAYAAIGEYNVDVRVITRDAQSGVRSADAGRYVAGIFAELNS